MTPPKTPPPRSTDEYIAGFPPAVRDVLERVRRTIRKAVPLPLSRPVPVEVVRGHREVSREGGRGARRYEDSRKG
jgi:hypothetical protein